MDILLYQARDPGDPMRDHEERCFRNKLSYLNTAASVNLEIFNLVTQPVDEQGAWERADAVFVGGSGHYGCVGNVHSWYQTFQESLRRIVASGRPMFCSCFGHQALAASLGGEVVSDRLRAELGTHLVTLNASGLADPMYSNFPSEFTAQFGHNDQVSKLPKGAVNLASTELCPIQSYRLENRLVYATQFHPEMNHSENQERAMGYLQVYDVTQTTPEKLARMFRPSHEASGLVARFLTMVQEQG